MKRRAFITLGGGVGYLVHAGSRTLAKLAVGEAAEIFVETQMSESAIRLFGFATGEERAWFALPTVKTQNKAQELALKAFAIQMLGIWAYRSGGTLNPDTDFWVDTTQQPDLLVNFEMNNDNWANLPGAWGTQWGDWATVWTKSRSCCRCWIRRSSLACFLASRAPAWRCASIRAARRSWYSGVLDRRSTFSAFTSVPRPRSRLLATRF